MKKYLIKVKHDNDTSFDSPCSDSQHDTGRGTPNDIDNSYYVWHLNIKPESEYLDGEPVLCEYCVDECASGDTVFTTYFEEIRPKVIKKLGLERERLAGRL